MLSQAAPVRRLSALLAELRLVALEPGLAIVEATDPAMGPVAQSRAPELEAIFAKVAGRPVALRVRGVGGPRMADQQSVAGPAAAPAAPVHEHPLVKKAIEVLGGRVTGVTPRARRAAQEDVGQAE